MIHELQLPELYERKHQLETFLHDFNGAFNEWYNRALEYKAVCAEIQSRNKAPLVLNGNMLELLLETA
jgi:hypothetical protein